MAGKISNQDTFNATRENCVLIVSILCHVGLKALLCAIEAQIFDRVRRLVKNSRSKAVTFENMELTSQYMD